MLESHFGYSVLSTHCGLTKIIGNELSWVFLSRSELKPLFFSGLNARPVPNSEQKK